MAELPPLSSVDESSPEYKAALERHEEVYSMVAAAVNGQPLYTVLGVLGRAIDETLRGAFPDPLERAREFAAWVQLVSDHLHDE